MMRFVNADTCGGLQSKACAHHTYTHTHTHTHIHTHTLIKTHTYTHKNTHTFIHTHSYTHIDIHNTRAHSLCQTRFNDTQRLIGTCKS